MQDTLSDRWRLPIAIVLSALLHVVLLSFFISESHSKEIQPLEVELISPPAPKQQAEQIVSPSESEPTDLEVATPLRSEQNTKVAKQQIRRGLESGQPAPAEKATPSEKPQKATAPKPEPKKALEAPKPPPPAATLRLTQDTLSQRLAGIPLQTKDAPEKPTSDERTRKKTDAERDAEIRQYRPFRFAKRSWFPGQPGVPDHLPTIQDGEITLLNTKADKYAVFVRRVALQVFGALRQLNWTGLTAGQIGQIGQFASVHAILNADGTLQRVYLSGSSGVVEFDKIAVQAAKTGAWDQNPPKGAQTHDGTIHFIFEAKTWARVRADGMGEQRWLLLATGLR